LSFRDRDLGRRIATLQEAATSALRGSLRDRLDVSAPHFERQVGRPFPGPDIAAKRFEISIFFRWSRQGALLGLVLGRSHDAMQDRRHHDHGAYDQYCLEYMRFHYRVGCGIRRGAAMEHNSYRLWPGTGSINEKGPRPRIMLVWNEIPALISRRPEMPLPNDGGRGIA
jgi:hypothetical protein